jgi:hypothetical protein
MAQGQIEYKRMYELMLQKVLVEIQTNKNKQQKVQSTQTGDSVDFCIPLCRNKQARVYWSKSYRDFVLAFNINRSKSFIVDRQMWKKLKIYLQKIDNVLAG